MPPRRPTQSLSSRRKRSPVEGGVTRRVPNTSSVATASRSTKMIPFYTQVLTGEMHCAKMPQEYQDYHRERNVNRKMSDKVIISPRMAPIVLGFLLSLDSLDEVILTVENPKLPLMFYHFIQQSLKLPPKELSSYVTSIANYLTSGRGVTSLLTVSYGNQNGSGYVGAYILRLDRSDRIALILSKASFTAMGAIATSMLSKGVPNAFLQALLLPIWTLTREEPSTKSIETLFHMSLRLDLKKIDSRKAEAREETIAQKLFRSGLLASILNLRHTVEDYLKTVDLADEEWKRSILGYYGEIVNQNLLPARIRMATLLMRVPSIMLPRDNLQINGEEQSLVSDLTSHLDTITQRAEEGYGSLENALTSILCPVFKSKRDNSEAYLHPRESSPTEEDSGEEIQHYDTSNQQSDCEDDFDDIGN